MTKTAKTPTGRTSNAILILTQRVRFHLLSCERKRPKTGFVPGSTRFRRLGFDLVTCPCEKGNSVYVCVCMCVYSVDLLQVRETQRPHIGRHFCILGPVTNQQEERESIQVSDTRTHHYPVLPTASSTPLISPKQAISVHPLHMPPPPPPSRC